MIVRISKNIIAISVIMLIAAFLITNPEQVSATEADPVIICIDPGHGGDGLTNKQELGAQYNGISEKLITLKTANAMKQELEKYDNVKVYLTRTYDKKMSLSDRVSYAKAVGADYLFCLHYNASRSHDLYGSEIWISAFGNNYKTGYEFAYNESLELQSLGLFQRGIKTKIGNNGDYYGILRYAREQDIPCALIEHCHIDQAVDLNFLQNNEDCYTLFGKADATAAAKYFHLKSTALGVDYTDYQNITVTAPIAPVYDDRTAPEQCKINSTLYNVMANTLTVNVTAKDSDSQILYYSYSLNNGATYSQLLPWDNSKTTDSVVISNVNSKGNVIIRVQNQYELYTDSGAVAYY